MSIKTIFKDSRKFEINRNYVSTGLFPDIAKFADFRRKNNDVSRTQRLCHVIHIFFGSSLGKV